MLLTVLLNYAIIILQIKKAVATLPKFTTATNQKKKGSYIIAQVKRNEKNKQQRSNGSN